MKKIIRKLVFETNSSSVHTIVIMPEDMFNKWKNQNGYLICKDDRYIRNRDVDIPDIQILSQEEALDFVTHYIDEKIPSYVQRELDDDIYTKEEIIDIVLKKYNICKFQDWGEGYEVDYEPYTSPSGDQLVVTCYYGTNY